MEKQEIIDRLNGIHNILAKSNLSAASYNEISNLLCIMKEDLQNENRLLTKDCEHYQHDHCDCIGKYCLSNK